MPTAQHSNMTPTAYTAQVEQLLSKMKLASQLLQQQHEQPTQQELKGPGAAQAPAQASATLRGQPNMRPARVMPRLLNKEERETVAQGWMQAIKRHEAQAVKPPSTGTATA